MTGIAIMECPICGSLPHVGDRYESDGESGERYGYSFIECSNRKPDGNDGAEHFNGVHGDSVEACAKIWNKRVSPNVCGTVIWHDPTRKESK